MILIFANLEKSDEVTNNIVKYVVNFGFVISLIGLLEYVLTYLFGFNVLRGIFSLVFRGNYTERLLIRGNLFSISVLNGEPNGFAIGILPGLMFVANGFYKTKKHIEIILILAYCSAGVFSSSLAGFALSLFGLFIFITNRFISKRSRQKVLMFSLALFLVIIAISSDYYFSRLAGLAGVRDAVGSEGIRTYSIKSAFQWFLERPLFGMGLGTVNCHGAIPALLASTGIIGSILWFLLTFSFDIKNWRKSVLFIIVLLFLSFLGTIGTTYSILPILLSMNFWSERS